MSGRNPLPPLSVDELPKLNRREQRFVRNILAGMSQSEAYKEAYNATGYSPANLAVEASRKRGSPKVAEHLAWHQRHSVVSAMLTHAQWLEMMLTTATRAEMDGKFAAAVQARVAVGKSLGYQTERVDDVTGQTMDDPRQTLDAIAAIDLQLAKQLADKLGMLDWQPKNATKPSAPSSPREPDETIH